VCEKESHITPSKGKKTGLLGLGHAQAADVRTEERKRAVFRPSGKKKFGPRSQKREERESAASALRRAPRVQMESPTLPPSRHQCATSAERRRGERDSTSPRKKKIKRGERRRHPWDEDPESPGTELLSTNLLNTCREKKRATFINHDHRSGGKRGKTPRPTGSQKRKKGSGRESF